MPRILRKKSIASIGILLAMSGLAIACELVTLSLPEGVSISITEAVRSMTDPSIVRNKIGEALQAKYGSTFINNEVIMPASIPVYVAGIKQVGGPVPFMKACGERFDGGGTEGEGHTRSSDPSPSGSPTGGGGTSVPGAGGTTGGNRKGNVDVGDLIPV